MGHNKRLFIFIAIIVLALAVGGGYYAWNQYTSRNAAQAAPAESLDSKLSRLETNARRGNDLPTVLKTYDQLVNDAKDTGEKRKILLSKALTGLLSGYTVEGIEAGVQADAIDRDLDSVDVLADLYADNGDAEKAKTYYQLSIDEAKKMGKSYDYYEMRLREFEK